ncbi:MAG: undecaprenyl-phosphate galactose phosphotransferase WbaP [Spirochaetes bacterium]|nr:undecaprenyl-phosphate galactose phosphotransferase WbaP [Spirochaetota bacterium]
MIKHRSKIFTRTILNRAILMAVDAFVILETFFIAYNVKIAFHQAGILKIKTPHIQTYAQYWYLILFYVFFFYFFKIYAIRSTFWQELRNIIKACVISTVFIFFILALLKISQEVSRFIIIFMGVSSIILVPSVKYLVKYLLYRAGLWQADSLIIADADDEFDGFIKNMNDNWYVGYRPGYTIKAHPDTDAHSITELTRDNLEEIIKSYNIVLPILYKIDKNKFYDIFIKLDIFFDNIKLIPDLHSLFVNNISIEGDGENILINFNNNLQKINNRIIHYLFNKTASILIGIMISPLLLIIAILIKCDSKGPVIYRAKRIGYMEKDIFVYKFRTMFGDADKKLEDLLSSSPEMRNEFEANFKLKDDPRVTRTGKFLRKTSLDELPQIFNVFKGEMSLVGPRPIVRAEVAKYGEAFYELIKVKPGISGLWQISGRNDTDYERRVQLDLFYIKNWSLWMDITILLRTFMVVIQGRGAY